LGRNALWSVLGNALHGACQWGVVVLLSKLSDPADVGRYTLGLAVAMPVIMLANLQLREVQATDVGGEHAFGDFLTLRLVTTALSTAAVAGFALVGYPWETARIIAGVGLVLGVDAVSDIHYGFLQRHGRLDLVARSLMFKGPLGLGVFGMVLAMGGDLPWAVLGLALGRCAVLVAYDRPSVASAQERARGRGHLGGEAGGTAPRSRALLALMRLSFPLGFVMMLVWLNWSIPRYVLERSHGEFALGIFGAVAYLLQGMEMMVRATGEAVLTALARDHASASRNRFRRALLALLAVGLAWGLAGLAASLAAGREILSLVYRPEYGEHAMLLVWVMASGVLSHPASFVGVGAVATRRFHALPLPHLGVTALAAAASLLLIPPYGALGAAWALCVVAAARFLAPLPLLLAQARGTLGRATAPRDGSAP
jgi:O-antigen/teichoic acid export membrane protein